MSAEPVLLAVDFGTSHSSFGFTSWSGPQILPTARGSYAVPSLLAWNGEFVAGDAAESFQRRSPAQVISDLKWLIGRNFNDPKIRVWKFYFPFRIRPNHKGQIIIQMPEANSTFRFYKPETFLSRILSDFDRRLQEGFGRTASGFAVSIPAWVPTHFNPESPISRRILTGRPILVFDELYAAALAEYLHETEQHLLTQPKIVLIVDFGAGKVAAGLFRLSPGQNPVEIGAVADDTFGCRDIDFAIARQCLVHLAPQLKSLNSLQRSQLISQLVNRCRVAKEGLSVEDEIRFSLQFNRPKLSGKDGIIRRAKFDAFCSPHFAKIEAQLAYLTRDLPAGRPDDALLLGGGSRIPSFRARILGRWGNVNDQRQHDLLVARGASAIASTVTE
jgi:molecular chaperone DnaK (HSP70)